MSAKPAKTKADARATGGNGERGKKGPAAGGTERDAPAASGPDAGPESGAEQPSERESRPGEVGGGEPSSLERELAVYPLRDGSQDPRWAVQVVWTWVAIAVASTVFTLTLIILGFFYD